MAQIARALVSASLTLAAALLCGPGRCRQSDVVMARGDAGAAAAATPRDAYVAAPPSAPRPAALHPGVMAALPHDRAPSVLAPASLGAPRTCEVGRSVRRTTCGFDATAPPFLLS